MKLPVGIGLLDGNLQRRRQLESVIEQEPGMKLVASGATLPWLLGRMAETIPQVVIIAPASCKTPTIAAIVRVLDAFPSVRPIWWCDCGCAKTMRKALRSGAWGLLDSKAEIPEILRAARLVAAANYYASQMATTVLLKDIIQARSARVKVVTQADTQVAEAGRFGTETAEELAKLLEITGLVQSDAATSPALSRLA
jgi:DNA-binding NarL/FixJ family response regulator